MSSDAIEVHSHLEAPPILSPSMPTLDVLFEPISQPILDPNDPSYDLSLSLLMILEVHCNTLGVSLA